MVGVVHAPKTCPNGDIFLQNIELVSWVLRDDDDAVNEGASGGTAKEGNEYDAVDEGASGGATKEGD